MTTPKTTVGAKGPLASMSSATMPGQHPSGRSQRVSAKAAHRRDLPRAPRAISFEALAEDPIYRRIAAETSPRDLAAEITRFGFESAADIAVCQSVSVMKTRMARAGTRFQTNDVELRRLLIRSRREALRSYRLMRHALAMNDPMNQVLRHTPSGSVSPDTARSEPVQAFAKPASLQSNQSPAAYLRYLYRMATGQAAGLGIFSGEDNPFALVNRRPDLAELVLNEANLKREVPTIHLVNEVLQAGISDFDMSRHEQTVALPYDHAVTTTRTAMVALDGTTINDIAVKTARLGLGSFHDHRWAQDTAGLIGLLGADDKSAAEGNTLLLISEATEDASLTPSTLGGLYKVSSPEDACLIDLLMSALGLDADGLAQLCGLYSVAQENGESVAQSAFATAFLANDVPITLRVTPNGKAIATGKTALSAPELRVLNYLARLHHGTGLDFHDLNTLLALPGAAADVDGDLTSNALPRRRVTAAGLRLLANYPLYQEAFELTPAGFAALFGEISPYRRADQTIAGDDAVPGLEQTEQSFMASLFDEDAPQVHRWVVEGGTSIREEALSTLVARGLGLSALELETLVDALDEGFALSKAVDMRGLAALYRIVTLCRMLGWPVLSGLTLMEQLSEGLGDEPSLWATLTSRNQSDTETDALCSAFEWLADLAHWMVEAALTPDALLALITAPPVGGTPATDADITWFDGVATAYAPVAVQTDTFAGFTTWSGGTVPADTWLAHMTGEGAICDSAGVFLESVTRDEIEAACRTCLVNEGIDPDKEGVDADQAGNDPDKVGNATLLTALVERLEALRDRQVEVIKAQVAGLDAQISTVSVTAFLYWAQTAALLDLLRTVLKGAGDGEALNQLAELRRHIAVVSTFELGDVELAILGLTPQWIAPELADAQGAPRPLDLSQLIWLQRFVSLQITPATDAALRGYLVLTNADDAGSDMPEDTRAHWVAGSRETLALLLNCPSEDMVIYADALIGPGEVARTVAQIDLIARHVRLAAELNLSALDLLALKHVSTSQRSGDWSAAAAAAQAGLARFDDGNQMPVFRQRLAERERDALVAAFTQTRIAGQEDLESRVNNSGQLYAYLLLDVNVTSAVPTSRIVEAISSLQLFISRALAGLEPGISFVDADGVDHRDTLAAQWEIDKAYRQWEANQKLMLYPQNYIEPELRQVTSPEFDALQQAVTGSDVTPDSVEAAVNTYMKDLAGVSDLSVCSFSFERRLGDDGNEDTLYHVLAKAKWEPGRFFYRQLQVDYQTIAALKDPSQYLKAMDWTYWQEVSVPKTFELFSDVTVCVFKNRYYFFWLELEERRVPVEGGNSPGKQKSLWRLHPRYMRSDQNALAGPMLTPGLFVNKPERLVNDATDDPATLTVDGAFEWTGAKPVLNGTFHPTRAPDGLVYGQLHAGGERDITAAQTLTATFGIELCDAVDENDAPLEAAKASSQATQLHIRLSEDWSDAILNLTDQRITSLDEAGPEGYSAIHPRPVTETAAVSEQVVNNSLKDSLRLEYLPNLGSISVVAVYNDYAPETLSSRMAFIPENAGGARLGSLEVEVDLGQRIVEFYTLWIDKIHNCQEKSGTIVSVVLELAFTSAGQEHAPFKTARQQRLTKPFTVINPPLSSTDQANSPRTATVKHPTNETFEFTVPLPPAWTIGSELEAELSVKALIKREFGSISIDTDGGKDTTQPMESSVFSSMDVGRIKLFLPFGKTNSAWTQTGEHGNRNFLHLIEDPQHDNSDTFVVASSSSVLSKLAKTMPRPGGCESLFKLGNHLDQREDYGTFLTAYPETLKALYLNDQTSLRPDRIPGEVFDFDSAYGAYGWEVFYHIPSAIAAGYASSGQFDLALQWLRRIYDPQLEIPWRVKPLLDAAEPTEGLAFDTGDVIVDPDRIARDYPFYYQQATIRNMLEVLLDAGDAEYEQQTQESLQRAKALYVSAKQLFSDNLSETLEALTSTPWVDPTLGEVARNGCDDFLPPYNSELRGLYATLERRLFNLRHWLDQDGQPLNVPLLAQPIDPRILQRSAKSRLALRGGSSDEGVEGEEDDVDIPLDFPYVLRSAKGYVNNLKLTSHRLQDASEKEGNARMEEFRMQAAINKADRAIGLQDFAIEAAGMEVAVKTTKQAKSYVTMVNHTKKTLEKTGEVLTQVQASLVATAKGQRVTYQSLAQQISAGFKATIPNTFGFSNGGQNLEQADIGMLVGDIVLFLYHWNMKSENKALKELQAESRNMIRKTLELTTQWTLDGQELAKASIAVARERATREELETQHGTAQDLRNEWDDTFGKSAFYTPFREDIAALYAEEWATTQKFCRLLLRLYQIETQLANGPSLIRTTSLGGDIEKFNAPHRLALDLERLEMAYIEAGLKRASETTELRFSLGELTAVGCDHSALEELTAQGEVYFQLTDEMFDVFYPGQYDRLIQSITIGFPGLGKAGLSPHARLTQVSNTRYMTPDRDPKRSAGVRKDRHGLQSLVLGACEIDTSQIDAPDGMLKRFQNTGVESCWHMVMPTVRELKNGKAVRARGGDWRAKAEKHHDRVKSHMSDVDFTVRFSGRWADTAELCQRSRGVHDLAI